MTVSTSSGLSVSSIKFNKDLFSSEELLWQEPLTSGLQGFPLLFPFAGRVWHEGREGCYQWEGQVYEMPIHGCSKALTWKVSECKEDEVQISGTSNSVSAKLFPFDFLINARIRLTEFGFEWINIIEYIDSQKHRGMPLAMGYHPFFKTPSNGEEVSILSSAQTHFPVDPQGNAKNGIPISDTNFNLANPLAQNSIIGNLKQPAVTLAYPQMASYPQIQLKFSSNFRFLTLWHPENSAFFCVEPWMSLPDAPHKLDSLRTLRKGEMAINSLRLSKI